MLNMSTMMQGTQYILPISHPFHLSPSPYLGLMELADVVFPPTVTTLEQKIAYLKNIEVENKKKEEEEAKNAAEQNQLNLEAAKLAAKDKKIEEQLKKLEDLE